MTSEQHTQPTSGGSDLPGGGAQGEKTDYVKYSTYTQVIDEVKSVKGKYKDAIAELNEYKEKEKLAQEQKLLDEKKHLEIIESLKLENERLSKDVNSHIQDKLDFRKMNAAMGVLQSKGINLESKYFGLLPIDQIAVTDDGDIDSNSVAKVVDNFQKEHPRLTLPSNKMLPNDKSGSSGPMLSVDEWKKLEPGARKQALAEKRVKY